MRLIETNVPIYAIDKTEADVSPSIVKPTYLRAVELLFNIVSYIMGPPTLS